MRANTNTSLAGGGRWPTVGKGFIFWLCAALGGAALSTTAIAEDNPDIAPKFRRGITPEQYHQLRDGHVSLLRGLPADPSLRQEAVQQRNRQLAAASAASPLAFSPGAWNAIGPNPIPNGQVTGALAVSGRVTAFAIDPNNTNKVYLGTAQGGVYRSTDGGTNWTPIFDTGSTSAVGSLALAPSNSTILYIGTGEANGSADSYAGVGLYRVDNCDTTATLVGPINPVRNYVNAASAAVSAPIFQGRSISSIIVHPTDPSIVFAGIAGGVIGIGGDTPFGGTIPPLAMRGLVRLTNATAAPASVVAQKLTVTLAASGFDLPNTGNRNVNAMFMDPADPNILTVWINGTTAVGDGGIYRSTNAQAANPTFTQVLATAISGARAEFAGYKEGANPTVIYVATGEGTNGQIRRSIDGGVTWSAALAGGKGFCGGQCFYNIGFDVLPGATTATSDDIVVIGGNVASSASGSASGTRLYSKSTDGGVNFTESSAGLHADNHFIRFDRSNTNVVWHGNDGGIFKSTNGGTTWVSLNNTQINTVQMSGLAVHPTIEKWAIGGTQDNGTNMRRGDGTWVRVDFGDGGYALIDRNATDETNITLYHTYFNQTNNLIGFGRILSSACAFDVSPTGLLGWSFKGRYGGTSADPTPNCDSTDTFNGIPLTDPVLFYAPMELGPGNPNTVYFGAGAVYRSTNRGDTMSAVSQTNASPVSTIAVSPQDDNYRIFGRVNGSVFYTTTGANPMTALAGIPARFVARAKFDPSNKNTAYIALGGYFGGTAPSQSHVWKITNLDTTPVVTAINNGLPDVPVNTFSVDPVDGKNLFAGTDIGVYASLDGGATWAPYGTDLPVVAVFGMDIQPTSRTLRIGTHGRGVWKIGLPPLPDLTVAKTHTGNFLQGQVGAAYTVTVTNSGAGDKADTAAVTVTDTAPADLTITAMAGTGWTCTTLPTCTRSDLLAAGNSYAPITVTVDVASNATSPLLNSVSVTTTAPEANTANNAATDSTIIVVPSDLAIAMTHVGNFSQGGTGSYTVTVTNNGPGAKAAAALVTVTDTPPSGLTVTAMSGSGWTCATLPTCTRSDLLAASAGYPPITVTVAVAPSATSPQINAVAVTTAATDTNAGNNSATDSTVIVQPDLTITKSHVGDLVQGQTGATYTVTVGNSGAGDKLAATLVTVTDTAPAGLTVTAMSGTGWTCATLPTCTRSDLLAASSSYPAITVTVNVAANATSPLLNSASVTTAALESNTGNNTATDSTTIIVPPDLTVTKSHLGNFLQGQVGATYTATVTNSGAGDKLAGATVSLVDTPPIGLTVTAMSGTGWTCTTLPTCTRSDVLASSASYPPVTITVTVAANAGSPLVNSVAVSTTGPESNAGNNTATDSTIIIVPPDLTVTKSHTGNFVQGQVGATYTVTVSNSGAGSKVAGSSVTLVDTAPSGLTITAMSGTGWSCTTLPTCTRSDVLAAGASYPPVTVTVTVAPNASSPQVNSVTVSTTAIEQSTANNTATDSTVVLVPPDMTLTKTHLGNFSQGQAGVTYTVTVSNSGAGDKLAADLVTVTDTPPSGITITAMSGSGWACTTLPTCTRSDLLIAGASYPPITVTVSVAANATSPKVNTVAVSTTALESNASNNTATDSTVILVPPDLTIAKSHVGNWLQGQTGVTYTALVTNLGVGDKLAGGVVTVVDTPPPGLTITAMSGTGWTCTTLPTCTRSDLLGAGFSYPVINITANVAGNATSPLVNSVTVSTSSYDGNAGNNTATDSAVIIGAPDLTVNKSHTGDFALGQVGARYTVVVTNSGAGAKAAGSLVTLVDTPPTGLTITAMAGPGWTCATLTTCTRSDALASGASYPPITVTVNVAATATSPQVNAVSVTMAGPESNSANNLGTDSTTIVTGTPGSLAVTLYGSGSGAVASQDGGIACGATCSASYVNGSNVMLTATPVAGSVFTGWLGACTGTGSCTVPIAGAANVSATFALATIGSRILDIDANTAYAAESDGALILRYLAGLRGLALTDAVLGAGATRTGDPQMSAYLLDILPLLDVDGNGKVDVLTDGVMILRKLLGQTGTAITANAVGAGATRNTAEIEAYIQTLRP